MTAVSGLRVAVVGGSIGGCAAASLLLREGAEVTVFERSTAVLDDRGAGISTSGPHMIRLRQSDLVDVDMPVVDRTQAQRQFTTRGDNPEGRVLWTQPIATYGMNWGIFYANLRRRVPDGRYHGGVAVRLPAELGDGPVRLELSTGQAAEFDLVVVADGYASEGRRAVFPELEMEYGGYVAWRGLIPEGAIDPNRPATEMAMHAGGHCVLYYVPGEAGSTAVGERWLNWVWYRSITEAQLAETLVDRTGRAHRTSMPRGSIREEVLDGLHGDARRLLRRPAADVVVATPDPFLQVVYDVHVPSHVRGRVLFVGDAACVARPHTGAGALKATQEALALAGAVRSHADLDDALTAWNAEAQQTTDAVFAQGRALGHAMVLDTPDWRTFSAEDMQRWWADASAGSFVYYADDAKR